MRWSHGRSPAPFLAALLLCGAALSAARAAEAPAAASFLPLQSPDPDAVRLDALAWLKGAGKTDAESRKLFDAVWSGDRSILDKVVDTLALGDPAAARLLADAADPLAAPPTEVPALLKDAMKPAFFRANLGLAYAERLSRRRVYEEALEVLKLSKPEQVVEPAAYLFHRAVAEYLLMMRPQAERTIVRLLEDAADAPERYRVVAEAMADDMRTWSERDLAAVARLMDNVGNRLELARGGPVTRGKQAEIVKRLDDIIADLERTPDGPSPYDPRPRPRRPGQPDPDHPGTPGGNPTTTPADDSGIGGVSGPGDAVKRKWADLANRWPQMPEKEQVKAMQELIREMPAKHRELIENYFRNLQKSQ
jgi:hypothetical protein